MKRLILAAAILFLATPAMAFQCPADVGKIDAAVAAGPALTAEQLAEVQKLRDEGDGLHSAGKHQEAVDTLAKAKAILGIE